VKVRVVRDRDGQIVCAVALEPTAEGEITVEPVLGESLRSRDVDLPRIDQSQPDELLEVLKSA
jgi:hypothetical protein